MVLLDLRERTTIIVIYLKEGNFFLFFSRGKS